MNKAQSRRRFIKKSALAAVALGCSGFPAIWARSKGRTFDLLIYGGTVYDGLGSAGREADVAVTGDRIARIAKNIPQNRAARVIDARGLAVCPGFIDAHSHTDLELLVNPRAESQVHQGVTTEISGNCGSSVFPLSPAALEEMRETNRKRYGLEIDWSDWRGYRQRLGRNGLALNHALLLGQGTLREAVIGNVARPASSDELLRMRRLVAEHMRAGLFGLSSGLEYPPSGFADTRELTELCRPLARTGGVYATHMRNEGDKLLEAVAEAIAISRAAGVRLQISHLKTCYPANWGKVGAVLEMLEKARSEGVALQADRYPYIAASTGLSIQFPLWAQQGRTADFLACLKDPALEGRIREALADKEKQLGSWDKLVIAQVRQERNKALEGQNVLAAARQRGQPPYEFMRDLLLEEEGDVDTVIFMMSEANLKRFLAHPLLVVGSDGTALAPYGPLGNGKPHPRHYGTFPRVLGKYARDEKIFPLEKAIQKMSSQTARHFGLRRRGELREGFFADVVVFDPQKVIDRATWTEPHRFPEGIQRVVVNGQVVIDGNEHTGVLAGRILKKI